MVKKHNKSNGAEFAQFHRHAYIAQQAKKKREEANMTVGQRLSALFKQMMPEREDKNV